MWTLVQDLVEVQIEVYSLARAASLDFLASSWSTMRRLPLMLACACLLVFASSGLQGQTIADTTTASFHPGEWGVGFILRNSVTDAGVLRFSTPTRAWVLDGNASFDRQSQSGSTVFGDQTARSWSLSAQFGPRWYRAMSGHVARYLGFGLTGGYAWSEFSGTSSHGNLWSAGAYGETGMQYLLTRFLGIGWRGTLSASRVETKNSELTPQGFVSTSNTTGYHLGLDAVQLTGTIYF